MIPNVTEEERREAAEKCGFCGATLPYHWRSCPYLGGIAPQPPVLNPPAEGE